MGKTKKKQVLTDITLVLDRSGSMASRKEDAEGGLAEFLIDQKAAPGKALLSLITFDNEYDVVHNGTPLEDVDKIELHPRGGTALLDAVGKAINTLDERLGKLSKKEKPDQVVVAIITDGGENSSQEYTLDQVKELIKKHGESWSFVFIGADIDSFGQAGGIGVRMGNVLNLDSSKGHMYSGGLKAFSKGTTAVRTSRASIGSSFDYFSGVDLKDNEGETFSGKDK